MNIYDIAAKCGVSIATVSRVLNDSPHVKQSTRDKVLSTIAQEGYSPNAFARGLGLGSMGLVGVLCTDLRDPFYAEAVGQVEEYLSQQGRNILLRCTGDTLEGKQKGLEYMVKRHVDAVVLIGSPFCETEDNAHIAAAAQSIPIITINSFLHLPGVYCITADEKGGICQLVEQLISRQRRRILFLYDKLTYSCNRKIEGYKEAYANCGLPVDDQLIVHVEGNLEAINTCIKQLLVKGGSFDAVVGAKDILAVGTQKALQSIGLNLPIIGFDNSILARCATPELSSIDNELSRLCATAMAVLDNLLSGKHAESHTIIQTRLVERDTFRSN